MSTNESSFEFKASNNVVGIPEDYKVLEKENIRTVRLVTGIDILGRIANPYIFDINRGFLPAKVAITNMDEANLFCRSHKPLYTLLADTIALCKGTIKLDLTTGLVIPEKSTISFYVPKGHTTDSIICSRLSEIKGAGSEQYPLSQLRKLEEGFYKQLTLENTESRKAFLCARILDERR